MISVFLDNYHCSLTTQTVTNALFNDKPVIYQGHRIMNRTLSLILVTLIYLGFTSSVLADDDDKKLFVSLISDDLDRAAMAVSISNKVLSTGDIPVTIFLSAQGVRWADRTIPQNSSTLR